MIELENDLKRMIIDCLDLEDIEVSDIDSNDALFVDGLGLDSIDALELGLALKKKYNVKIDADDNDTKKHFASVHNLALLVQSQATENN